MCRNVDRCLAAALVVVPLVASAQPRAVYESTPLKARGVVEEGPCPAALVLRAQDGARFELDRARIGALRIGESIAVEGGVYSRVSVCRRYPWLDLTKVNAQPARPPGVAPVLSGLPKRPIHQPAPWILIVVAPISQLRESLEAAQALRNGLPNDLPLAVGVAAPQKELIPALTRAIGENFDLIEGLQVMQVEADTASKYLLRSDDGDLPFASLEVLLSEWRKRVATAN